ACAHADAAPAGPERIVAVEIAVEGHRRHVLDGLCQTRAVGRIVEHGHRLFVPWLSTRLLEQHVEQTPELQFAIERDELVGATLAEAKPLALEGHRTIRDDSRQFPTLARLVCMRLQEAAELVSLHLGQVREE